MGFRETQKMRKNKNSLAARILEETDKQLKNVGESFYLHAHAQGREYVEHNLFITLLGMGSLLTIVHGLIGSTFYESS